MEQYLQIIKEAKKCHTKLAWLSFFATHEKMLVSLPHAKPLEAIFKALKDDPQSLRYGSEVWAPLLQACLSSWNLELGKVISSYTQKIPSAEIAILAADIYMQSGSPKVSRSLANRGLRLSSAKPWEKLQLQMTVCNSYVEEGKQTMAIRQLGRMESAIKKAQLPAEKQSGLLVSMARAQFFLGRYLKAAAIFQQASEFYLVLKNWEYAAKGLFNAAASYHNAGKQHQKKAFKLVEKCQSLAEQKGLEGALSHCFAFYGTDAYQHGWFQKATKQFDKALKHLPESDKSFRRLHITSMLAFTHLKLSRFQTAKKYAQITFDLASHDESERFRSRYVNLQAEILWNEGRLEESQTLLGEATAPLFTNGASTLEELSAISRYFLQASQICDKTPSKVRIADQLKNSSISWLEFLFAKSQLHLSRGRLADASKIALECIEAAKDYNASYCRALGTVTLLQTKLISHDMDDGFYSYLKELEEIAKPIGSALLDIHLRLIYASLSYKKGDFAQVRKLLGNIEREHKLTTPTKVIIQSWLTTIDGHSPKLNHAWHVNMVARATKIYFDPALVALDQHTFRVSGRFIVDLARHPLLAKVIHYLLTQPDYAAKASDLQKNVWQQSLSAVGWQQKIRNTIMRVRDLFPYTIAPLILHSDNQIRLYKEAIRFRADAPKKVSIEEVIAGHLEREALSSAQLALRVEKSPATVKRLLKKMGQEGKIVPAKSGRLVVYELSDR